MIYLYGNKTDCEIVEQAEHELHSQLESNYDIKNTMVNWHHLFQSQTDNDWLIHVDWVMDSSKQNKLDNASEVETAIDNLTQSDTKPSKFEPPREEL